MSPEKQPASHRGLTLLLRILLVMIVGLMALGAGVRTMNAGLSCPDWPLCFGKVIPDFHPGVWFEFVHRAYAGMVALVYLATCVYVLLSSSTPKVVKRAAVAGLIFLLLQIAAGALTVLWLVKWFAVTTHLLLATLFFCSVLWMLLNLESNRLLAARPPAWFRIIAAIFALAVFVQIFMGGVVASTYAGSVCVDWPLCAGQWVPTWAGPIGHQIIHRLIAYVLALGTVTFAVALQVFARGQGENQFWVTATLLRWARIAAFIVVLQVGIGVANLVFYIPPWLTVLHQSVAILFLATWIRIFHLGRRQSAESVSSTP